MYLLFRIDAQMWLMPIPSVEPEEFYLVKIYCYSTPKTATALFIAEDDHTISSILVPWSFSLCARLRQQLAAPRLRVLQRAAFSHSRLPKLCRHRTCFSEGPHQKGTLMICNLSCPDIAQQHGRQNGLEAVKAQLPKPWTWQTSALLSKLPPALISGTILNFRICEDAYTSTW